MRLLLISLYFCCLASYSYAACVEDSVASSISGTNTLTLTTPTNHPANDVILAAIVVDHGGAAQDQPVSTGGAYTLQYCNSNTAFESVCFFTRIATGSDAASYTFTVGEGSFWAAVAISATGCNTSTPVDTGTTAINTCFNNGNPATSCNVPAATLATAGALVVTIAGQGSGDAACSGTNTFSITTGSGYTAKTSCGGGGLDIGQQFGWGAAWDQAFSSAGSTGVGGFTATYGGGAAWVGEGMIALAGRVVGNSNGLVIIGQ